MSVAFSSVSGDQVPAAGGISLDHVAHWVPAIDAASARMEQLGFALTPYSSQRLPPKPGEPSAPAGTGNRCIMLRRGYIEVLTVEPGTYIRPADNVPEAFWNIGVRIEDDVMVTETGHENLTAATPKTVAEVEAACAR